MKYREQQKDSESYKIAYRDEIYALIEKRQKEAADRRADYAKGIFREPERYRRDFCEMLGWPLTEPRPKAVPAATAELLSEEDGYTIYRMQIEILDGVRMQGLLFRQNGTEPRPLVIAQHGGSGSPELVAGMYEGTSNYADMLHRVRKQGVHVFAPQLLLWSIYAYGAEFERVPVDARLKRVGSSITALEVYGLTRILDYFEAQDYVTTFGMVGLSYGGFYTLYTAAVDTRIRSAVSCSYFNTRDVYPWADWTWFRSAERFDDAEIACLVYPRRLAIEVGDKDELFDYRRSEESFARLQKMCAEVGADWVSLTVFDGVHEFYQGDEHIEQLIRDLEA